MNLTRGQKIISGVALAVAMLLVASIKISCFSDRAGTITAPNVKTRQKMMGNLPPDPEKTRPSGQP